MAGVWAQESIIVWLTSETAISHRHINTAHIHKTYYIIIRYGGFVCEGSWGLKGLGGRILSRAAWICDFASFRKWISMCINLWRWRFHVSVGEGFRLIEEMFSGNDWWICNWFFDYVIRLVIRIICEGSRVTFCRDWIYKLV